MKLAAEWITLLDLVTLFHSDLNNDTRHHGTNRPWVISGFLP